MVFTEDPNIIASQTKRYHQVYIFLIYARTNPRARIPFAHIISAAVVLNSAHPLPSRLLSKGKGRKSSGLIAFRQVGRCMARNGQFVKPTQHNRSRTIYNIRCEHDLVSAVLPPAPHHFYTNFLLTNCQTSTPKPVEKSSFQGDYCCFHF